MPRLYHDPMPREAVSSLVGPGIRDIVRNQNLVVYQILANGRSISDPKVPYSTTTLEMNSVKVRSRI